jgi:hypothetical protein
MLDWGFERQHRGTRRDNKRGWNMPNRLVSLLIAAAAFAAWMGGPLGAPAAVHAAEFRVSKFVPGNQWVSTIGRLNDGGFVVAWQSDRQRPSPLDRPGDIYAQRFDKDGTKVGGEFPVNSSARGSQTVPALAVLTDGSFVVVWVSNHKNPLGSIYGQHFSSDGKKVGRQFLVQFKNNGAQNTPEIAALTGGGYVVVWATSPDGSSDDTYDIAGQQFGSDDSRVGGQFVVNSKKKAGAQLRSYVAAQPDGGYVVVWDSAKANSSGGTTSSILGQRYAADGSTVGATFQVFSRQTDLRRPRIATLESGGFVVVWEWLNKQSVYNAYAQRYSADADKVGGVVHIAPVKRNQFNPNLTGLVGGGYVVAWADEFADIRGQRLADDGSPVGDVFRINGSADEVRDWPVFAASPNGGFTVTWDGQDNSALGVFGRIFNH